MAAWRRGRIVISKAFIVAILAWMAAAFSSTTAAASITFVGASSLADFSGPVSTVTIDVPAGVQSGDTLVAQILVWDGSGSDVPAPPNGWTSIRHDSASNGNNITSWLYYRVAGSNEPASYGWNIGSQWAAGAMGAWRGGALSPLDRDSGAGKAGASPLS
jgi:hypothetical protein